MRKIKTLIIIGLIIILLTSCLKNGYKKISAEQAKEMMDNQNVIIVDVREQSEFNEGHIEGAILIPLSSIETLSKQLLPDYNAVILVYCRSGRRSKEGALKLIELGYVNVYDFGGIIDWPYDIIN